MMRGYPLGILGIEPDLCLWTLKLPLMREGSKHTDRVIDDLFRELSGGNACIEHLAQDVAVELVSAHALGGG